MSINPQDYFICFKWMAKVDYTQPIRKGSGRKNARKHSGVSLPVIGHSSTQAKFSAEKACKKKNWKNVVITELQPVGISFGFLTADPEQRLEESLYPQIPMPV